MRGWQAARLMAMALVVVASLAVPAVAKTEVVFWHAMGGPLGDTLEQMVDDYNRTHPGVEIVAQYQGNYGQLRQKLLAAVGAGQAPTVSQAYSNWTEQLFRAGAIVPLDPFIKGPDGMSQADLDDFYPVFLEANRWDGTTWSLPFNKSIYVTFYNATTFKELGLAAPATWDELLRVARASTLVQGGEVVRYGYGMRPNVDHFALFFLTNGGEWLAPGYEKARFNEKAGVEALQFMVDLLHKYKAAYYITGYLDQDFAAGKVAAYATSVPGRPYMEQAVGDKFEWGVSPLPVRSSKRTPVAGTDLVIYAGAAAEQQREAWRFIKWLTSPEQTARWSVATFYLPVRQSAVNVPAFREYLRKDPRNGAALVLLPHAVTDPPIEQWEPIRNAISPAVEQAFLLKATPQEALDQAAQKANAELAKRR